MCQPKRAPSAAQKQAEALADIERIATALYQASGSHRWEDISEDLRGHYRDCVRELLHRDVIRVGTRPVIEQPMEGQTTIEEQLDGR